MQRRAPPATSAGCASALAGCGGDLPFDSPDGEDRHPFARRMADASAAREAGENTLANEALNDANEHVRAFNAVGPVQLRDIAVALGLVRGFDRDDPIVDVEEDKLD